MTLDDIRKYTLAVLKKHQTGGAFSPEQFNKVIVEAGINLFNIEYDKAKKLALQTGIQLGQAILDLQMLVPFIKNKECTVTSGILNKSDINSKYAYVISAVSTYNSKLHKVDFISAVEADKRRTSVLFPVDKCNIGVEFDTYLKFYPTSSYQTEINYIKEPTEPIYDYCYKTTNNEEIYMPVSSRIEDNDSGGYKLVDSGGVLIEDNVEHITATSYPYTSNSVEYEWDDNAYPKLSTLILSRMGISVRDQEFVNYMLLEERKQNE